MADYISNYTGAQIDNAIGIGLSKGAANGIASLNASGKVPSAQLPDMNFAPAGHGYANSHQTTSKSVSFQTASLYARDGTAAPFGLGSAGGQGGDGCIIIYYRKLKPLGAVWLRDNTQKPLLDRLGRRLIV